MFVHCPIVLINFQSLDREIRSKLSLLRHRSQKSEYSRLTRGDRAAGTATALWRRQQEGRGHGCGMGAAIPSAAPDIYIYIYVYIYIYIYMSKLKVR
jgi:hypothetical protein